MTPFTQSQFDIRCEWGLTAVQQFAADSDAIVIVDVLSFTTCVSVTVECGAVVLPYAGKGEDLTAYAQQHQAQIASKKRNVRDVTKGGYSLSPSSLQTIPPGTRIVLPSPNGSTLSTATGAVPTFAASLRNARAVAHAVQQVGNRITVIPAGERWQTDWVTLRPSLEDYIGAGAVIHHLTGHKSYEAQAAAAVFAMNHDNLYGCISNIGSGIELIKEGYEADVRLATQPKRHGCYSAPD